MSDAAPDLDAYFARIGYAGPREPTLAALRGIVARHSQAIPFENLDVLAGRGIRLDLDSLQRKLLSQSRGGYCFEQNALLLQILRALGFRAAGLAARVRWGRPPDVVPPRSHMLLQLDLAEGPYLADVGFGGLTPTAPLAFATGSEQATPHESFRIVAADDAFDLQARLGGDWTDLYRFTLYEQAPADYAVANWFTSTYPESLFVRHLIAARPAEGCRYTLFNGRFSLRHLDGRAERRTLASAGELGEVLSRYFGIAPLPAAELDALADLVAARADAPNPFDGGSLG